jgi:hypothetical protein
MSSIIEEENKFTIRFPSQLIVHFFDHQRVVAALTQLHFQVVQTSNLSCRLRESLQQHRLVPFIKRTVKGLLQLRNFDVYNVLL